MGAVKISPPLMPGQEAQLTHSASWAYPGIRGGKICAQLRNEALGGYVKIRGSLLILRSILRETQLLLLLPLAWSRCSVNMPVERGIKASGGCRWTRDAGNPGDGTFQQSCGCYGKLMTNRSRQKSQEPAHTCWPVLHSILFLCLCSSLTLHHFECLSTFQGVYLKDKDAFKKVLI